MNYLIFLFSFLFIVLSFKSTSQETNKDPLIGIWIRQSQSNDTVIFKRNISSEDYQNLDSLEQNKYRTKVFTNLINNNEFPFGNKESSFKEKLKYLKTFWKRKDLFNPLIVSSFNGQSYYQFIKNGEIIVSQNCGWCGTPPISYCEYKGKWSKQKNDTFDLSYPFWGGTIIETWEITTLSKEKMAIIRVDSKAIYDKKKH